MNTQQLVLDLKENKQDFEFYPTTPEMLKIVRQYMTVGGDILDVGAGNGAFKRYLDNTGSDYKHYYAIEKSEILINQLDKDTYILATDFNQCTLIDKKVDTLFCNPPYSEFKNWTIRIIKEGNFKEGFLIIPERWRDDPAIKAALDYTGTTAQVLAQKDFLTADRQARAKVHIVKLIKKREYDDNKPFDDWFKDTFGFEEIKDRGFEYQGRAEREKAIKQAVVEAPNKIECLVNLYNDEMNRLYGSFKAICQLDVETLHDIGVETAKVKQSLKQKIESTKILYWRMIFDYLDEITKRLTHKAREKLFERFERLNTVDFNASNVRAVVVWVLKNASSLFDEQLIDFYKDFTTPDNIIKYKSNQKVFKRDHWYNNRFDRDGEKPTHYCLSYRLIADNLFNVQAEERWSNEKHNFVATSVIKEYGNSRLRVLEDLEAIAFNLGFETLYGEQAAYFGEKYYIKGKDNKPLIEYKIYKNGNTHLKLNIEFAKALNVEVARLLGWIRDKSEVVQEFPEDMKDAAKYYGANFRFSLDKPNIKLLSAV